MPTAMLLFSFMMAGEYMERSKDFSDKLATLPTSPGVYLMKNEKGKIIYVGKSKCLKNRVSSYFSFFGS